MSLFNISPLRDFWARKLTEVFIGHHSDWKSDSRSVPCPRICFVKQSTQSDLYCTGPDSSPSEIVASTLMRSGPVALFSALKADFRIVEPEDDLETRIWRQPAEELGWVDIKQLEKLRDWTPLSGIGQSQYASMASNVDWSRYDIVISLDISVPARITRQYPNTVWCYYVREPKSSAYSASQYSPLPGYDLFLNQEFNLIRKSGRKSHEICFPYYLQYPGCFDDLFSSVSALKPKGQWQEFKRGLFLEHHSAASLTLDELDILRSYWPLHTTAPLINGRFVNCSANQTLLERLSLLQRSTFFLSISKGRSIWGNALIESIAAGCAVLGDPNRIIHSEFLPSRARVKSVTSLVRNRHLVNHPQAYLASLLRRQSDLINYACWSRPIQDLFTAVVMVREQRHKLSL